MDKEKIIDYISDELVKGTRMKRLKNEVMKNYGVSNSDFNNLLSQAKSEISAWNKETEDIALDIQLERLQSIYDYAEKSENLKVMTEIQKEIDRIRGLQQQNIKADIDSDFTVSFQ